METLQFILKMGKKVILYHGYNSENSCLLDLLNRDLNIIRNI